MSDVRIWQIYYSPEQVDVLEKGVEHFFNSGIVPAREREFGVMRYFYENGHLFSSHNTLAGFISWKFREKARVPAQSFVEVVKQNPEYDLYILNPFPDQVLYWNTWFHAEAHHPGMIYMVSELFERAGVDWNPLLTPNVLRFSSFCNFWVGNEKFWALYMQYGERFYQSICADKKLNDYFFRPAPGGNLEAPYFAFFFERLVTEVLHHHPEIRVCPLRYSRQLLKARYRDDVAEFIEQLPVDVDLNFLEGERLNSLTVAEYRHQLTTDPSFFRRAGLLWRIFCFFDRHRWIRGLLSNKLTRNIKRKLLNRQKAWLVVQSNRPLIPGG